MRRGGLNDPTSPTSNRPLPRVARDARLDTEGVGRFPITVPLQPRRENHPLPSLPLRSLTRGVLAVVAATTLVVVPVLVQAEESDDPRQERDRVREQAADVAAELDGHQA